MSSIPQQREHCKLRFMLRLCCSADVRFAMSTVPDKHKHTQLLSPSWTAVTPCIYCQILSYCIDSYFKARHKRACAKLPVVFTKQSHCFLAEYLDSGYAGPAAGLHGAGPNAQRRGAAGRQGSLQPRGKLIQVGALTRSLPLSGKAGNQLAAPKVLACRMHSGLCGELCQGFVTYLTVAMQYGGLNQQGTLHWLWLYTAYLNVRTTLVLLFAARQLKGTILETPSRSVQVSGPRYTLYFHPLAYVVNHRMHPALVVCFRRLWGKNLVLTSKSKKPCICVPDMCQGMEGRICVAPLRSDHTLTVLGGNQQVQ